MKLHLTSLGCAKNLVDSEVMLGRLLKAGWSITQEPADADVIVVNTCSFIRSAVDESIDTILELAKFKNTGICRRLIVSGCLPERFGEDITKALPEVDFFLGTGAYDKIIEAVENTLDSDSRCHLPDPNLLPFQDDITKKAQSSPNTSYIKIAEGCSRHCTYCIIPKLRGNHRSRPLKDILKESRYMIQSGIKELIFVAQDTTYYGKDLNPKVGFGSMLEEIADISHKVWIRFLYGHPESIDDNTIKAIARNSNICSYFDIPIQHASDNILKKMGRNYTNENLLSLFENIRMFDPDACLRTTIITGFPGETDRDFQKLLTFVKNVEFNHLGVFTYSDSEDIPAHNLSCHVPAEVAQERLDHIISCQADISLAKNRSYIGKTRKVLVEKEPENSYFSGRTSFQAPDVDGITYIGGKAPQIGSFADVMITDASDYDLIGETV